MKRSVGASASGALTEHDYPDCDRYNAEQDRDQTEDRTLPRSLLKFSGGHSSFRRLPDRTLRV
jgi:hypothetical protein